MARRVFFSFHYADIFRVKNVRNSWGIRGTRDTQPFFDHAEWEKLKRTNPKGVTAWIDKQLSGSSVTVVLIGSETSKRKWVRYEIRQSIAKGNGLIGIYIDGIRSHQNVLAKRGANPFDSITWTKTGQPISNTYHTYDWVRDNGYHNLQSWIEAAAKQAGRL